MIGKVHMAGAAIVLGAMAFGATGASAHPIHLGIHVGGIHLGGWVVPRIRYRPVYSGCYVQRYVNVFGGIIRQRVCY